jgi:D-serine deaminase-like pyridoxal phosphate-dependent protein
MPALKTRFPLRTDMHMSGPRLVVLEDVCRKNIAAMSKKFRDAGIAFRPHFKTHRSPTIANWFRDEGINTATVSSAAMAHSFAGTGWDDLTLAFPFYPQQSATLEDLCSRINMNLLLSDISSSAYLSLLPRGGRVFIEIDTGHGRSGLKWENFSEIEELVNALNRSDKVTLEGFLTHAGHAYHCRAEDVEAVNQACCKRLASVRDYFGDSKTLITSAGDTPSCSLCDSFPGINELRPGNFVFYDLMQLRQGTCRWDQIASLLYCPVAAVYPERGEAVICGGAVHFSAQALRDQKQNEVFGVSAMMSEEGVVIGEGAFTLCRISQEHGVISGKAEDIAALKPGMFIPFIPVHSCLTMNLATSASTFSGEILELI